ncbi:hypothetical protein J7F03_33725 [Streptomyces sp. ISL-43]|uniref:hypothetical protein n=1 Tax=Streptomyces sp. ISL-43 TaxID=2819183 RepID=UPI001BE89FAB|nr:hypothetical protein [Streptomyces sp. ISL-43]MBT2451935.1 hypothetical protein [Streptomyces sp. ISL-43]
MNASASMRLGLGIIGVLLAAGLLLAARAAPEGRAQSRAPDDVVFRHPGAVVSHTRLQHAKQTAAAGEESWTSAYKALLKSRYASLDHTAHPAGVVP